MRRGNPLWLPFAVKYLFICGSVLSVSRLHQVQRRINPKNKFPPARKNFCLKRWNLGFHKINIKQARKWWVFAKLLPTLLLTIFDLCIMMSKIRPFLIRLSARHPLYSFLLNPPPQPKSLNHFHLAVAISTYTPSTNQTIRPADLSIN